MLWGYFQKIVIADRVGLFGDTVYDSVNSYEGGDIFCWQAFCLPYRFTVIFLDTR